MSYNGSGLFQINTSGQPVVAGTVITASAFNALTADLATGLTTAITKDGQTATTAQIPFAQGLRSTLVTDSTTSTSGSIITDGGLGVAKAVNIGTTLGVTGAVTGSSTITGTKLIPTGTSVTGNGMYLPAANTLGFSTNGTNAVTIDGSQNVGVGVTPSAWAYPAIQLGTGSFFSRPDPQVGIIQNGYSSTAGGGWKYVTTAAASYYNQSAGAHAWFTAASGTAGNAISWTQAMTLDASGNLGVGTTSPACKADVNGMIRAQGSTISASGEGLELIYTASTPYFGATNTAVVQAYNRSGSAFTPLVLSASQMAFATGGSERARIDSSGNLLVGTTSQYSSGKVNVLGTASTNGIVYRDAASNYTFLGQNSAGTNTFLVNYNGNVTNTNNSYGPISDIKLKENIVDATPKLDDLMKVRVVNYNLKADLGYENHKQIGVIAQELEQVFAGLVDESPDKDEDGNALGTTTKSVKMTVFIPMLIKALQEQQALIQSLTDRLTALEGAAK